MELDHFAKMAKMHWEQYLPKYYKKLVEAGILEETLMKASKNFRDLVGQLAESGLRKPEIDEIALPQYILLPPEAKEKEDMNRELEMEDNEIPEETDF